MKKMILNKIIVAVSLLIIISACKRNNCREGYICVDNACICPEDKFEGNGMCRDLKPNEYYADLGHCACKDTIFFEILGKIDGLLHIRFDLGYGVIEENYIRLIPSPSGDSIYTNPHESFTQFLACPINGRLTTSQIFGKFIENNSKIRITLKYMAYPSFEEEMGRCEFVLHK